MNEFIAALIGAVVGGLFTLWGTRMAMSHDRRRKEDEELQHELRLLKALHDEFKMVWARYDKNLGYAVEAIGETDALTSTFPIYSDFFPVYRGNTSLIGSIQNAEIREGIVRCYTMGAGMVDSFTLNNALIERWLSKKKENKANPEVTPLEEVTAEYEGLVFYAQKLKTGHFELKITLEEMLSAIQAEIRTRSAAGK